MYKREGKVTKYYEEIYIQEKSTYEQNKRQSDTEIEARTALRLVTWVLIVAEKLKISSPKKEMENFIWASFEDYNLGRASQKALRALLPVRSQNTVYISFLRQRAVHQMTYYWQVTQSRSKPHCSGSCDPLEDQEHSLRSRKHVVF